MAGSVNTPLVHAPLIPLPSPQRLMSPSRLAKLPPITSNQDESQHLHTAKSELKDSMHHLLDEAQTVEIRMQTAVETLWKGMVDLMESKERDFEKNLLKEREELTIATAQLKKLTEREAALASQNTKQSVELVAAEKRHQSIQEELVRVKGELKSRETELGSMREDSKSKIDKSSAEMDALRKKSVEQSKIIKEYQEKISKMTEKLQKLSGDITSEKELSQQLQKNSTSQMNQKTSENRKMALEISKLKAQLASSATTLSATKNEVKKLETQLTSLVGDSEANVSSLNKKHNAVIRSLEEKIQLLIEELARQQATHEEEIHTLNEKVQNAQRTSAGEDDYMLARIKFLQHQNQQEKVKLQQQKSK